ncbi:MAG: hypothetical protein HYU28_04245 [Actinobacteria bacterium]|nr:hypothetical protein [Actinomycetota bacterium]
MSAHKVPREWAGRGNGNGLLSGPLSGRDGDGVPLLVTDLAVEANPGLPAGPTLWLGPLGPSQTVVWWLALRARARR